MRLPWIPLVAMVAACSDDATSLLVNVEAPGLMVSTLTVIASVAGTDASLQQVVPAGGGRPTLPGRLRVILPDVSADVTLSLHAVDDSAKAHDVTRVVGSQAHHEVEITMVLDDSSDGGGLPTQLALLAGADGQSGSTDALGAAARFDEPAGLAADDSGNVYVADRRNHVIRKISADGHVSTLAGTAGNFGGQDGAAAIAQFYEPRGLCYDGQGSLFVADASNHAVRQVVIATGVVSTLAGTAGSKGGADGVGAAARFDLPLGITADRAGGLYVADTNNQLIRKIDIASRTVSRFAGSPGTAGSKDGDRLVAATFNNPVGLALGGAGDLLVSDSSFTMRRIVVASGVVTTPFGQSGSSGCVEGSGAGARFGGPAGVLAEPSGSFLVADAGCHAVRRLSLEDTSVTTFVGALGQSGLALGPLPGQIDTPFALASSSAGVAISLPTRQLVLIAR